MDFNDYQEAASKTATYPDDVALKGLIYCTLGLTGEAGEFANKVKKIVRGDKTLDQTLGFRLNEYWHYMKLDCLTWNLPRRVNSDFSRKPWPKGPSVRQS